MSLEEIKKVVPPDAVDAITTLAKKGAMPRSIISGVISGLISFGIFAFGLGEWKADVKNDIQSNKTEIAAEKVSRIHLEERVDSHFTNEDKKESENDFAGRIFFLEDHLHIHKWKR